MYGGVSYSADVDTELSQQYIRVCILSVQEDEASDEPPKLRADIDPTVKEALCADECARCLHIDVELASMTNGRLLCEADVSYQKVRFYVC